MEKKRWIIFICVGILFFSLAVLGEAKESLFSGYFESYDLINVSGSIFTGTVGSGGASINMHLPSGNSMLVREEACEIRDEFEVCFDFKNDSYHNYTTDQLFYKAYLTIYHFAPVIDISRTIAEDTLLLGETVTIWSSIENTGDAKASDVLFMDTYDDFMVKTVDAPCKASKEGIVWEGSLSINKKIDCRYILKATVPGIKYKGRANASYFNGVRDKLAESDENTILVKETQLKMDSLFTQQDMMIGDLFNYTLTISNNNTEKSLKITSFSIVIPSELTVKKKPGFFRETVGGWRWNGLLEPEETKQFVFQLKADMSSKPDFIIKEDVTFLIDTISNDISNQHTVTVTAPPLAIGYNFAKEVLEPNETTTMKVFVSNPSSLKYQFLEAKVTSNLPDFIAVEKDLADISSRQNKDIISVQLQAPAEQGSYVITTAISYKSTFGEFFQIEQQKTINVGMEEEVVVLEEQLAEEVVEVSAEEPTTLLEGEAVTEAVPVTTILETAEKPFISKKMRIIGTILLVLLGMFLLVYLNQGINSIRVLKSKLKKEQLPISKEK